MLNKLKCKLMMKGDCSHLHSLSTLPRETDGLEILGAPIGSDEFVTAVAGSKIMKAVEFCKRVAATVNDPQVSVALLSMCTGACRVTHLMKTVPPPLIAPALNLLDGAMLIAFERSVGVSVPTEKLDRVFLPLRMSGFGLRRSLHLCFPAYLTAKMNFRFNGATLLQLPDGFWQKVLADLHAVICAFQATASPSTAQALQWLSSIQSDSNSHPDFCSLRWWANQVSQQTYNLLVDRALIRCLTDRHANAWLQPCPTENLGLRLTPAEYTVLCKLQLGEPLFPGDSEAAVCGACGEAADPFGDQFLCCRKGGLIQRHTAIASQLWRICTAAGVPARPEVSLNNRMRPADLLLSHWQGGGP